MKIDANRRQPILPYRSKVPLMEPIIATVNGTTTTKSPKINFAMRDAPLIGYECSAQWTIGSAVVRGVKVRILCDPSACNAGPSQASAPRHRTDKLPHRGYVRPLRPGHPLRNLQYIPTTRVHDSGRHGNAQPKCSPSSPPAAARPPQLVPARLAKKLEMRGLSGLNRDSPDPQGAVHLAEATPTQRHRHVAGIATITPRRTPPRCAGLEYMVNRRPPRLDARAGTGPRGRGPVRRRGTSACDAPNRALQRELRPSGRADGMCSTH